MMMMIKKKHHGFCIFHNEGCFFFVLFRGYRWVNIHTCGDRVTAAAVCIVIQIHFSPICFFLFFIKIRAVSEHVATVLLLLSVS